MCFIVRRYQIMRNLLNFRNSDVQPTEKYCLIGGLFNRTRVLPSISIDDGFVSTAAKLHLQKFWVVLMHWSEAFDEQTPFCRLRKNMVDANRAFCQLWNGAFDDHMAFCWPWNGVLGASAGFASPGTTF